MTRFVVDAGAVLYLASEGIEVSSDHELLAPTLLRSQTLSVLHEAVHGGELASTSPAPPRARLAMPSGSSAMPYSARRGRQRSAWDGRTYTAEYVASLSCRTRS